MKDAQIRSPWYVRTWGWILLLWGLLNLFAIAMSLALWNEMRATDFIPVVVIMAGAIGLLSGSRWGWGLGMLVGILEVSAGAWIILDVSIYGGDITVPAAPILAVFFYIIPGLLLIWSLLTPRTRLWLNELSHSTSA